MDLRFQIRPNISAYLALIFGHIHRKFNNPTKKKMIDVLQYNFMLLTIIAIILIFLVLMVSPTNFTWCLCGSVFVAKSTAALSFDIHWIEQNSHALWLNKLCQKTWSNLFQHCAINEKCVLYTIYFVVYLFVCKPYECINLKISTNSFVGCFV